MSQNWPRHDMTNLNGTRLRRMRQAGWSRALVQENHLKPSDLIWPLFIIDGENERSAIKTMPGVERLSIDLAVKAAKQAQAEGVSALALFPNGAAETRTEGGEHAWDKDNLLCRALSEIKSACPDIGLISDTALDPYTSHGQDGLVENGIVLNDETVEAMVKAAIVQAAAGADIVAPSDMMDGRVGAIRAALDADGYDQTIIMSYAAKYASCYYGPFRDAIGTGQRLLGDKRTYQMDFANSDEALREIAQDLAEGADMVMVKPGLAYLDIVRSISDTFNVPLIAYQVSGEYAMIEFAAAAGALDRDAAILESLYAFKRAGCDGLLTYYALEMARRLNA